MASHKQIIQEFLGDNEIISAINYLLNQLDPSDNRRKNTLILLKSQWNEISKSVNLNLANPSELSPQKNRIKLALLDIADKLKPTNLPHNDFFKQKQKESLQAEQALYLEKLDFFNDAFAISSDTSQKFTLKKDIDKIKKKLAEIAKELEELA